MIVVVYNVCTSNNRKMVYSIILSNEQLNHRIVEVIARYLPQDDLCSISMLNHHLHLLILPHLYRSLTILENEANDNANTTAVGPRGGRSSLRNCKCLIRSLEENPSLARHVRLIRILRDVWFNGAVNNLVNLILYGEWNCLVGVWCEHDLNFWHLYQNEVCLRCQSYNREILIQKNHNKIQRLQLTGANQFDKLASIGVKDNLKELKCLQVSGLWDFGVKTSRNDLSRGKAILQNLNELQLIHDPYSFMMRYFQVEFNTNITRLSIDKAIRKGSHLLLNTKAYVKNEANLIKSCPLLKELIYRFNFGNSNYFEEFFTHFLYPLPINVNLEMFVAVGVRNFNKDLLIMKCDHYSDLLKLARFKLTLYYNVTHYIDYK